MGHKVNQTPEQRLDADIRSLELLTREIEFIDQWSQRYTDKVNEMYRLENSINRAIENLYKY